jgi:hypothetical protein
MNHFGRGILDLMLDRCIFCILFLHQKFQFLRQDLWQFGCRNHPFDVAVYQWLHHFGGSCNQFSD